MNNKSQIYNPNNHPLTIMRIWPSGYKSYGKMKEYNGLILFTPFISYHKEGGVTAGDTFGCCAPSELNTRSNRNTYTHYLCISHIL